MNEILTYRLRLVPVDIANASELWNVLQEPDLREFQDIPRISLEEFERQVRARPRTLAHHPVGRFEWIIRDQATQTPMGWLSLRINSRTASVAEIGYSLLEAHRSRGYATEALSALVDEAFRESDLAEIHAASVPENSRSRAVLERCGFQEVRTVRNGALVRGRRVDVVTYEVHRGEWQRRRA